MDNASLKYINVSRTLTLRGWNYYEKSGINYKAISKSRYLEAKRNNKAVSDYWRKTKSHLRNS